MNILYLAHRIPYPPNKGDKMRAFRQLQHLCERNRVWCACFVDSHSDFRHVHDLRKICEDVGAIELHRQSAMVRGLWSLAKRSSLTEGFYASPEMTKLLARWQQSVRFDAVVAFSSGMANHALTVNAPRHVLDLCDLDSRKWTEYADRLAEKPGIGLRRAIMRKLYQVEGKRLAAAELRWIDRFDAALLATSAEAQELSGLVAQRKLHVVGNGIDIPKPAASSVNSQSDNARPVVGFVGVMDYLPNVDAVQWFAKEVWPKVLTQSPDAQFRIVGRSPTKAVRMLDRLPGVLVTGEVPDASREVEKFDVSVAPLRIARGIQNKVLEAMAAEKPVVLTSRAANGIQAVAGRDYIVADDALSMADSVLHLLSHRETRDRIGGNARQYVAERHSWRPVLEKFEAIVCDNAAKPESEAALTTPVSMSKAALPLWNADPSTVRQPEHPIPV